MSGMTPELVLWPTCQAVVNSRRNARGLVPEYVGARGTLADRLAQRAKLPPAGGHMVAYLSPTGEKLSMPTPASSSEAKISFGSETPPEVSYGQSAHSDKVVRRFAAC